MAAVVIAISIFCFGAGLLVLWANPRRFTNQAFSLLSLFASAWLWSVFEIMSSDGNAARSWIGVNGALSAFLVWAIELLRKSIVLRTEPAVRIIASTRAVLVWSIICAALAFTNWYYLPHSTELLPQRGPAYYSLGLSASAILAHAMADSYRRLRARADCPRVELQFLVLNPAVAAFAIFLATAGGNLLDLTWLRRTSFFIFLGSYALAAWAIAFHRVYTPGQIFLSLTQRTALIVLASISVIAGWKTMHGLIPHPADVALSVGLSLSGALWLDRKSRGWLQLDGEAALNRLRAETIRVARIEPDPGKLVAAFQRLLRREYQTPAAHLIFPADDVQPGQSHFLPRSRPAHAAISALGWATPESVEKLRATLGIDDLRIFLSDKSLGIIVTAPKGILSPSLIIALARKTSGWPFTYPEVQRLQSVAELMDNILTRSRLMAQAALRAKMEHLAMMSRGLAHDLKNLLTPVSTFLVHTQGTHPTGSVEEEVHSAAMISVATIADYVREALFFANQLTPQFALVSLSSVGKSAAELSAPRAGRCGIALVTEFDELTITADQVLLQRLLVNLINNAIDAETAGGTVRIGGTASRQGWVMFDVTDGGCGIAPEDLPHAFEPYFTTKVFGNDVRGFGLGLTICQKIAELHRGTIRIDSKVGAGTTVTVELPVNQPERELAGAALATK